MAEINESARTLFEANIDNYIKFRQWCIWYPDLFLDSITPSEGHITLDFDQRFFLRALFRFYSTYTVLPRASGKCITGDSILYTDKGMIEIGSEFNYSKPDGEIITSHDFKILNRYGEQEGTKLGISSGKRKTKKITTNYGYSIEGTLNHPVLIMDEDGEINFKNIGDLKEQDRVVINRKNNLFGNNVNIDRNDELNSWIDGLSKQAKWQIIRHKTPDYLDKDLSYIIGVLIGDGCLTRDDLIILSTKDDYILNKFCEVMERNFSINRDNIKYKNGTVDYVLYGKYIRKYFELIGLKKTNAWGKEIPDIIMTSNKDNVSSFLSGLFDTDGTIGKNGTVTYCTVSEKLAKQVQIALLNFGIISSKIKKKSCNGKYHFIISISGDNVFKFKKEIGFKLSRKQDRMRCITDKYCNTNIDNIPYQKNTLNLFCDNSVSKYKYKKTVKEKLYHSRKGNNELTYYKLDYLLKNSTCGIKELEDHFLNIFSTNYFYDSIVEIEESENFVYDIQTEKTHSFVSNGFVSHNTMIEVLAMVLLCAIFPNLDFVMTAQTKENAASIFGAKIGEIRRFYPLLSKEMKDVKISKNSAEVTFISGSRIFILANQQQSKGQRCHRMNIEESALLNNELFLDVLEPIPAMPRRTVGKQCIANPFELNGQINFLTTAGFRASDEFDRVDKMIDSMANLEGQFSFGADWQLACWYGRGPSKEKMLKKKEENTPLSFAQNYASQWVGASDGALVQIKTLLNCRTLLQPKFDNKDGKEMYLAIDVARSDRGGNQTALAVLEVVRNENGFIKHIDLVNIFTVSGETIFSKQALIIKKTFFEMGCVGAIIDSNGLGKLMPNVAVT